LEKDKVDKYQIFCILLYILLMYIYIRNLLYITPTEKKNETEKCKTILSGDVNAPSVRAFFHLTAFYSGWKLLLYNIISPYIRNLGLNPTNIRLCKRNVNHLQYEIIPLKILPIMQEKA
jgi:hypothetical protein